MDAFIGEIRLFAGKYAPEGWLLCDGSAQSIAAYQALYALIGATYGGSSATFNLPNLNGRLPVGQGQGSGLSVRAMGQTMGENSVTLSQGNMPGHNHAIMGSQSPAVQNAPSSGEVLGTVAAPVNFYNASSDSTRKAFSPQALQPEGGSQPHANEMPSISINYIICWDGLFPQQG